MQNTNLNQDFMTNFISMLQNASQPKILHNFMDCYEQWINYSIPRVRPDTIIYYRKNIKYAIPYLQKHNILYIEDLTILKMNAIVADMKKTTKLKNNTINKVISSLKQISSFCYKNNIIEYDLIQNFEKLKKDDVETIIISDENLNKIFDYLNSLNLDNIHNLRNIIFLYLLKDTGARLNELRHIEINNIDFSNNTVLLTFTKTHNYRKVYITETTKQLINVYLNKTKLDNKYLFFCRESNQLLADDFVYKFLNKIKKACNINQSISPHKWRHTLATILSNKNIPLENIRKLLGHSSLEITKKYLHVNDNIQKDLILKALEQ